MCDPAAYMHWTARKKFRWRVRSPSIFLSGCHRAGHSPAACPARTYAADCLTKVTLRMGAGVLDSRSPAMYCSFTGLGMITVVKRGRGERTR